MKGRPIRMNTMGPVVVRASGAALNFLLTLYVSVVVSERDFGIYALWVSSVVLLYHFVSGGLAQEIVIRWGALGRNWSDATVRLAVATLLVRWSFATGFVFLCGLWAGWGAWLVVAIAIGGGLLALCELGVSVARATDRQYLALLPKEVVWRGLAIVGTAIVAVRGLGVEWVIFFSNAALLVVCMFQGRRAGLLLAAEGGWGETIERWGNSRRVRSTAVAVMLGVAVPEVTVIVVATLVSEASAGPLFLGTRIAAFLALPLLAMNTVVGPRIARAAERGDRKALSSATNEAASIAGRLALVGLVILAVAAFFGADLVPAEYVDALRYACVLGIGRAVSSYVGPTGEFIIMVGESGAYLRLRGAVDVATLFLVLALAWNGNLYGVAWVVAGGGVALNLWIVYWLNVKTSMGYPRALPWSLGRQVGRWRGR